MISCWYLTNGVSRMKSKGMLVAEHASLHHMVPENLSVNVSVNTWLMDLCSIRCLVGAGFAPWHVADQSRDEVFMAAQESVGAHRDSQGKIQRPATFIFLGITGHYMFWFHSC